LVFTGPSGVGKTQLAEHLAAILHMDGGPVGECLKQIPMNQYQDEGSIATLIGPPVGVVGEGQLTGALMRCPTAVIILDEFEKAHPKAIPDVFLGAFDARAQLVDTKSGQTVPTNRATFILTSNFGAESILAEQVALLNLDPATRDLARQRVKQAVQQAMVTPGQGNPFARSEFRGRIRSVVIFSSRSNRWSRWRWLRCSAITARILRNAITYFSQTEMASTAATLVFWIISQAFMVEPMAGRACGR
jgi:ATP-dependent Clp protease ATP-binding subunit ClpB